MKFTNYIENNSKEKVAMLLFVMENADHQMNEDLQEGFVDFMKKLGLPERPNKGIIDYFVGFTSVAGKIILAAINGDDEKIRTLMPKITRQAFVDFLVTLDKVTFGIITSPLEFVSSITGWDLEAQLTKLAKGTVTVVKNIHTSISALHKEITAIFSPRKAERLNGKLNYISKNIPKSIPK